MSGRFNSLISMTRQWMLSIVLVLAPISTNGLCCCSQAAAMGLRPLASGCQSSQAPSRSCCQRAAKNSRNAASDRTICRTQCRCGEWTPSAPVVVRESVESTGKILNAQWSIAGLPIQIDVDQALPQAGELRHDQLVIRQNRAQAILCVWRN